MIKVEFVCDACRHTTGEMAEDLLSVVCKACRHQEALKRPLELAPHQPKIVLRSFTATDPDGHVFEGLGVDHFAKNHGLNASAISRCLNGQAQTADNWTFQDKGNVYFHTTKEREQAQWKIRPPIEYRQQKRAEQQRKWREKQPGKKQS